MLGVRRLSGTDGGKSVIQACMEYISRDQYPNRPRHDPFGATLDPDVDGNEGMSVAGAAVGESWSLSSINQIGFCLPVMGLIDRSIYRTGFDGSFVRF